ncbi:MAG TPA: helix-turn-helix transcriptional regulator [Bacillota bacterium]|nr:helix-turn-helix transcriptional regulator [Bacillota bacterium]HPE38661.1 helix-turn-helix transcriptional regulator [Bacillota bacterium]
MIIVRLDRMMADRKMSLGELAARLNMTNVNLSNLKTGKMKGIRFETMNSICEVLECQPGDLFEFVSAANDAEALQDDATSIINE